jgi:mono/diheme cytochrome c family protein
MPSQHYYSMSDEDLGALIAYLKTIPPVDNETPEPQLGPPAYIAAATSPDILPVQIIDHDALRPSVPEPGPTVEYGEYLVTIGTCRDCHGEELNGDVLGPEDPPASNLTPGGELAGWTEADYIQTIRTGVNPAGRELQEPMTLVAEVMARATDEELAATFAYLQSLPARETGY